MLEKQVVDPGNEKPDLSGDAAVAAALVPGRLCVQQIRENLETVQLSSTTRYTRENTR